MTRKTYFRGLKCRHKYEVAEYVGEYKFLRCTACHTPRRVK